MIDEEKLSEADIDAIIAEIKKSIVYETVNPGNIIRIVALLMKILGGYRNLTGLEKKRIVELILHKLIKESLESLDEHDPENYLTIFLQNTLSMLIDTFIEVEKGSLKFNKKKLKLCCPCLPERAYKNT